MYKAPIRYHLPFVISLVLLFAATTLPFRCHYPINWDAAQFVLGVRHFDVRVHQPHPPGYPLLIGLARIVDRVLDSPHLSVLIVVWAFGLGALLVLYWLVFSLWGSRWAGFYSAVGLLLNPLFWYYRETALTYTVDAFVTLLVGGLSYRALSGSPRLQYSAAVALGLLGGVRPSLVLLLAPVVLFPSLAQKRHRATVAAVGLLGISVLAWLIPLIALSGGVSIFMETSSRLAVQGAANTSVLMGAGTEKMRQQLAAVIALVEIPCNLMLLPALLGALTYFGDLVVKKRVGAESAFLGCWILPSLLFFVLVHLGQPGYLLILIPLVYVSAGRVWVAVETAKARSFRAVGVSCLIGLLLLHGMAFPLMSPEVKSAHLHWKDKLQRLVLRKASDLGVFCAAVIKLNDKKIEALTETVRSYPVSGTLVITTPPLDGTIGPHYDPQPVAFRTLGTTCPEYRLFLLGPEPHVPLTLQEFKTEYLPTVIEIPPGGNRVVVLLDHIPPQLMPGRLDLVGKDQPAPHYLGLAEGPFEFLGVRFEPLEP